MIDTLESDVELVEKIFEYVSKDLWDKLVVIPQGDDNLKPVGRLRSVVLQNKEGVKQFEDGMSLYPTAVGRVETYEVNGNPRTLLSAVPVEPTAGANFEPDEPEFMRWVGGGLSKSAPGYIHLLAGPVSTQYGVQSLGSIETDEMVFPQLEHIVGRGFLWRRLKIDEALSKAERRLTKNPLWLREKLLSTNTESPNDIGQISSTDLLEMGHDYLRNADLRRSGSMAAALTHMMNEMRVDDFNFTGCLVGDHMKLGKVHVLPYAELKPYTPK